jgi:hypothetical protein
VLSPLLRLNGNGRVGEATIAKWRNLFVDKTNKPDKLPVTSIPF